MANHNEMFSKNKTETVLRARGTKFSKTFLLVFCQHGLFWPEHLFSWPKVGQRIDTVGDRDRNRENGK